MHKLGELILKERMRKVWVCCIKGEEEVKVKLDQDMSAAAFNYVASSQQYSKNLQGMKMIAFITDLTVICNWFLGFCALTWASAVLLGAYITDLRLWDYYDVSLLLFVEGLRFGLAGFLRVLGYRLSNLTRWSLQSIAFSQLPLGMGGFAVLSILPPDTRRRIHDRFVGRSSPPSPPPPAFVAPPPFDSPYQSLTPSLKIFYALVLLNAFILLLSSSIIGLMRQRYVKSNDKSLCRYHDKLLLDSTSTSWLSPTVDLDFAFQILASQYREGKNARDVCQNNTDLIWYLYMDEKGVEAVEVALAAENRYLREAAANIIGFWAMLEAELVVVNQFMKPYRLCFQREMLSRLADIAAESYGSLGTAAARSFMLLLKSVDPELIGVVASVRAKSTGKDLIEILLNRAAEFLHPAYAPAYTLPCILQEESHAYMYALREYLCRLQSASKSSDTVIATYTGVQQAKLVQKIKEVNQTSNVSSNCNDNELEKEVSQASNVDHNEVMTQSLNKFFKQLLIEPVNEPSPEPDADSDMKSYLTQPSKEPDNSDIKNYDLDIKKYLLHHVQLPSQQELRLPFIRATFLLLFNVAVPLVCLGVGFIVSALL